MKRCTRCGEEKALEEFTTRRASHDGLTAKCKVCKRAEDRAYAAKHREKARLKAAEWYAKNKERAAERARKKLEERGGEIRARRKELAHRHRDKERAYTKKWLEDPANRERKRQRDKEWRERNKERKAANDKRWAEENRDKCNAAVKRYEEAHPDIHRVRTHLNGARRRGAAKPDADTRDFILILEGDPCCYCGEPMTDIDHIEPLTKGGDAEWTNLTSACRSCNASKHAKHLLSFLLEGRSEGVEPPLDLAA